MFMITCSKNSLLQFLFKSLYKGLSFSKIISIFSSIYSGEISIDILNLNN